MSCINHFYSNTTDLQLANLEKEILSAQWGSLDSHFYAWALSGIFAWSAIALSIYLIYRHLCYYHQPQYQKHIVRILCMVPVYSKISILYKFNGLGITSWLTFRYFDYIVYLELARGLMESFVIYEFFKLLMKFVGKDDMAMKRLLATRVARKMYFPLCFFTMNPASTHFLNDCRIGVLQYVIIRPVTTIFAIILEISGNYCPESLSPKHIHLYFVLLNMVSTALAMYTMVTLYMTIRDDIKHFSPINKFLSVKFVIFFTFWQSLIIGLLSYFHVITATTLWTAANIATGAQSFCICIEMFIASLWHMREKCFGYQSFIPTVIGETTVKRTSIMVGITDAFNPMDTFHEIWHGFTHLMVRLGGMISSQNRDNSTGSDLNLVEKDEALLTALKNENLEEPKKENLDDE